jgi:hypothetical protein
MITSAPPPTTWLNSAGSPREPCYRWPTVSVPGHDRPPGADAAGRPAGAGNGIAYVTTLP